MTRVAVITPIGPLTKWGYQHTYEACIGSQAAWADRVFLVHSTADRAGIDALCARHANVEYISTERTWFHAPGQSDETLRNAPGRDVFNFTAFHMANYAVGRYAAWQAGYDVALSMMSNTYIPQWSFDALRAAAIQLAESGECEGMIYRAFQLGGVLFRVDRCAPWLANLCALGDTSATYCPDFKLRKCGAVTEGAIIVDCHYERTIADEMEKAERFRYLERLQVRGRGTETDTLVSEAARRFRQIPRWDRDLCAYGQAVATRSQGDFMSQIILAGGMV
jgi:hypothetical protein